MIMQRIYLPVALVLLTAIGCQTSKKSTPAEAQSSSMSSKVTLKNVDVYCVEEEDESFPNVVVEGHTIYLFRADTHENFHLVSKGDFDEKNDKYKAKDFDLKLELDRKHKSSKKAGTTFTDRAEITVDGKKYDAACSSVKEDVTYIVDAPSP